MKSYVDMLGIVWIAWGIWQLVIAVSIGSLFLVLGGGFAALGLGVGGSDGASMAVMGGFYGVLGMIVAVMAGVMAIPSILAGGGIRRRAGWARIVAMILAALGMMNMPLGTLLGIATFVVLLDKDVGAEFDSRGPGG